MRRAVVGRSVTASLALAGLTGVGARPALAQPPAPRPTPAPAPTPTAAPRDTVRPRPAPVDTARRRPAPPATPAVPGDTLRRPPRADTVRTTRDSVTVAAPIPPAATDPARIDSVPGVADSAASRQAPRDSIKAPIARAELPTTVAIGPTYVWTRDSVLATGAFTLSDLLERVPGLTSFRTGWLASAQHVAYWGDFQRLRVFRDGVELDAVDPRTGGILDLPDVQLWQTDAVAIEQTAGEVRVHIRSWTVQNTTPYTRVDVYTGDEDTNLYRGFYGRRWQNGGVLQIAAQNFGTGARNQRLGGGGDAVSALARVGWARGRLSVDALLSRVDRQRNETFALGGEREAILGNFEGRRDEAYLRAAYGDPDGGPWVQAVANVLDFTLSGTARDSIVRVPPGAPPGTRPDTVRLADSSFARTQLVVAGGLTRWGVRLSATNRARLGQGRTTHAPALRLAYDRPLVALAAYAERLPDDSVASAGTRIGARTRADLTARMTPVRWLALLASASRTSVADANDPEEGATALAAPAENVLRGEIGVRLGRGLWLTGGRVRRDGGALASPRLFALDTAPAITDVQAGGTVLGARGRLFKDVFLDVAGTAWDQGGIYRPQYHLRGEARVETQWLSRFPGGNFGLRFAVVDEYRSRTLFVLPPEGGALEEGRFAPPSNVLSALLELRIQRATVTYQLRNALNREYQYVPGFTMPGPINFYGVRWEFWN